MFNLFQVEWLQFFPASWPSLQLGTNYLLLPAVSRSIEVYSTSRLNYRIQGHFNEVSLEWLGGSPVALTDEQPSRGATKLYTFLVH